VTNAFDSTVSVIDAATGTVTATLPVGNSPLAVAADSAAGTVYVANYNDNTVSVIDVATGTVTATLPVGSNPTGVAVDPAAGTAFVANAVDSTVSVIDVATRTVTATLPVGSNPSAVAVDPVTHTAYVTSIDDSAVSVISEMRVPTALTARIGIGLSPHRALVLTATLTAAGRPLSGQPVSFTTGRTRLCTRDTNDHGLATCALTAAQARQAARSHAPIQATYPGNTTYQPSSATATPPSRWWPGA
jgi:YVTN family beta-propeller protein